MRSVFVIINQPLVSDGLNLFKIGKKIRIEHLSATSPIKALDKGILVWLAWLDISDGDAFGRCPFGEHLQDQFRPIVQPYGIGWAVAVRRFNTRINRADGIDVPISMVRHSRFASSITFNIRTVQGVMHEIQCPAAIRRIGQPQRLPRSIRQSLLAFPGNVQTHIAIYPMYAFLVPATAVQS